MRKNRLPFGIPWIPQGLSAALLMGTFVLGVGTGVTVDSAINTNPKVRGWVCLSGMVHRGVASR